MKLRRWTSGKKTSKMIKSGGRNMYKFKSLNLSILSKKKSSLVSTEESLKDITPINWSDEVLLGNKKILVNKND